MPWSLKRYYNTGALHFITCSCYHRHQFFATPERRDLLVAAIEDMRQRYHFVVVGYVVMPEHFHLLISEPEIGTPSTVIQAVTLSFSRRVLASVDEKPHFSRITGARNGAPIHIWQRRFYDFKVWSQVKQIEKVRYMHRNPVARGLVQRPEDWPWSSFLSYATGQQKVIRVNDWSRSEKRIQVS